MLDSGIRSTHEEFIGANVLAGRNFVEGDDPNDVSDTVGHGTAVASLIAGQNLGTAPGATVMPLRVAPADSFTIDPSARTLAAAYAREQGAQIQNMSFTMHDTTILNLNAEAGVLSVLAAGNDGEPNPDPWALYDPSNTESHLSEWSQQHTLVVGAVRMLYDENGNLTGEVEMWEDSDRAGEFVMHRYLVAPGHFVPAAYYTGDDTYHKPSGTSYATPQVSAAAAVVWAADPSLSAVEVADILLTTADDLGDPGVDVIYGHGLLNLEAALQPVGLLGVPAGDHSADGLLGVSASQLALPAAFGDALSGHSALRQITVLDSFNRPYAMDLSDQVRSIRQDSPLLERLARVNQTSDTVQQAFGGMTLTAAMTHTPATSRRLNAGLDDRKEQNQDSRLTTLMASGQTGPFHYTMMDGGSVQQMIAPAEQGGHWLQSSMVSMPQMDLIRDPKGASLTSLDASWGRLSLAYASGTAQYSDHSGVDAGIAAWQTQKAGADWTVMLSHMIEQETFLGANASGALGVGGQAASSTLGMGVSLPLSDTLRIVGAASVGSTQVHAQPGSMLQDWQGLRTSSLGLGLLSRHDQREMGLRVLRPLRVDSGQVVLNVPVARTLEHEIVREQSVVELSPSGQEIAIESFYRMAQGKRGLLGVNVMYRLEPNHVRNAEPEWATLLEGSLSW